jgi:uncharacterized protein YyaL (SSP411 family)
MNPENKLKKSDSNYNHLINEKSPYLIQHADNPVDWYPWGEEAFKKAKNENKPIFLSIGYSTCHWCHVMAHESFEDPEIGSLMNEVFVSIKVDREERPDLDNIYMTVCQLMTGTGGWPLTVIMTPNKKPFFAGTYFPKISMYGRVGLKDLILNVRDIWEERPEEVLDSADQIIGALQKISETSSGDELGENILGSTYKSLSDSFDDIHGGFGVAPKFPTAHNLLFLLRYWKRTQNERALHMVRETLDSMRNGGIYDHIGFGFHRYSVDQEWLVPHFEKMLYDQSTIATAYIEAFQATGDERYKDTAQEIFEYVLRDMQSPEGGFYSAEDADSEGVEGKFYVWKKNEIYEVLGNEDAEFASEVFGVNSEGNFSEERTGEKTGSNILHLNNSVDEIAEISGIKKKDAIKRIKKIRKKLFNAREKRVHPHKDDKILTDWNGLMISALSKGAQVFDSGKYLNAAKRSADFILDRLCQKNRLLHRFRDGEAAINANLDDYAFFVSGLLDLYEASFDGKYLKFAIALNNTLLKYFWDEEKGGFYFTPDDGEDMLVRKKEIYDSAVPSGNSIQMLNLLRISKMTGNEELRYKAVEIEKAFSQDVIRTPIAHTQLMVSVDFKLGPSYEIVIAGAPDEEDTKIMLNSIRSHFIPDKTMALRPPDDESSRIIELINSLKFKKQKNGKSTAYICSDGTCKAPTTDLNTMLKFLTGG